MSIDPTKRVSMSLERPNSPRENAPILKRSPRCPCLQRLFCKENPQSAVSTRSSTPSTPSRSSAPLTIRHPVQMDASLYVSPGSSSTCSSEEYPTPKEPHTA